jgi:hypothetical protein
VANNKITYFSYDMGIGYSSTPVLQGELPLTGVSWSKRLNGIGALSATLDITDPRMKKIDAITATRPTRTFLVVDIDGAIAWCGIIWTRNYSKNSGQLTLGCQETWSYMSSVLQAKDYMLPPTSGPGFAYWSANPASPDNVAAAIIADFLATPGIAYPLTISVNESYPAPTSVVGSYPLQQAQTISSIVSALCGSEFGIGFDYALDVTWATVQGSYPVFTYTSSFPRRGRIAGTTGLVIDTTYALDYSWPEDGSKQYNDILVTGAATTTPGQATDANATHNGYPLLQLMNSQSAISSNALLQTAANDDLHQYDWPIVTPSATIPLWNDTTPPGSYIIGDDFRFLVPPGSRFPNGVDTYMRCIAEDVTVVESGLSKLTLTFNTPPSSGLPTPPPQ